MATAAQLQAQNAAQARAYQAQVNSLRNANNSILIAYRSVINQRNYYRTYYSYYANAYAQQRTINAHLTSDIRIMYDQNTKISNALAFERNHYFGLKTRNMFDYKTTAGKLHIGAATSVCVGVVLGIGSIAKSVQKTKIAKGLNLSVKELTYRVSRKQKPKAIGHAKV